LRTIVTLSYFHRKIGPVVFYSYPEYELDEQLSKRIANIMDQTVSEGFFTHSFENRISMNYYFEISSEWARGNKEMLMVSIIVDRQVSPEIEREILNLCKDFSDKLRSNEDIYTAFYINDVNNLEDEDKERIFKNNSLVKLWVKELYWAALEDTREKSEEEKIAALLKEEHIFKTMKKLSKGPISLEELKEWFDTNFPDVSFQELMDTLVEKQVLLLKEVNAERIPPDSVIEFIEESPDQVEKGLIDILLPRVQEYFSMYENKTEEELEKDSYILFQIISDPRMYNVLSKLPNLVSKRTLDHLNSNLNFLKKHDIIEEIPYKGDIYIVLKTNIQITTAFPEYLRKLLPKETKPVVAEKYDPKQF